MIRFCNRTNSPVYIVTRRGFSKYFNRLKSNKYQRNFSGNGREYLESNILLPVFLGFSTATIAFGAGYHYNKEFRTAVRKYLSDESRQFFDEYVGPDNMINVKKKIDNIPAIRSIALMFGSSSEIDDEPEVEVIPVPQPNSIQKMLLNTEEPAKKTVKGPKIPNPEDELATQLTVLVGKLESFEKKTSVALEDFEKCVRDHADKLKAAIEDDGTSTRDVWTDVNNSGSRQQTSKHRAETESKKLESLMLQLEKALALNASGEVAMQARQRLQKTRDHVAGLRGAVERAQFVVERTEEYRNMLDEAQAGFKRELESLGGGGGIKQSDSGLGVLVLHAHKRVARLQARVAELETLAVAQSQAAGTEAEAREREKASLQLAVALDSARDDAQRHEEMEVRRALARQAAAHSEHLSELLRLQASEIERQQDMAVRAALLKERERLRVAVEAWRQRVEGVEAAVEGRADAEKAAREAQDLWAVCHSLRSALHGPGAHTPPLGRLLAGAEEAAQSGASREAVQALCHTMEERQHITDGVDTKRGLLTRWRRVHTVCDRVAMMDELGGGLFMHMLSWLRSLVLLTPTNLLGPDSEVDPDRDVLDTHVVTASTDRALGCGDIELAVRLLGLLRGLPRAVADDWMRDARAHLEASQLVDALSGYTASRSVSCDIATPTAQQ